MCMEIIYEDRNLEIFNESFGFKRMHRANKYAWSWNPFRFFRKPKYFGIFYNANDSGLALGKTYRSSEGNIVGRYNEYPAGFHIYKNVADAVDDTGVVVKVIFNDVVAVGKNSKSDSGDTVIARNMTIIKELEYKEIEDLLRL